MNMRHNGDDFSDAQPIVIRDYATFKQDKARREHRIRLTQISLAGRRIADDYPDLAAWLCFSLRPRSEFAVEEALLARKVHALVPRRKGEEIRRKGRIIPAPMLPVLPGYVLIRCVPSNDAVQGILRFDRLRRVTGVLGNGITFHRVSPKFVNRFIEKAESGEYDHRAPDPVAYEVGQAVRITDGPFASFPGFVTAFDGPSNRVMVEIAIFGRATPAELDVAQVEKV